MVFNYKDNQETVNEFIYLLQKRYSLFSIQNLTELSKRISELPDEVEKLAFTLERWFQEQFPATSYQEYLPLELAGDDEPPPLADTNHKKRVEQAIKNAIIKSKPFKLPNS